MAGSRVAVGGTLLLDGAAVARLAAGDPLVRAHLEVARARRARVVVSAVTLAEVLGVAEPGEAGVQEVLGRVVVHPVTVDIARAAGSRVGGPENSTVDAIVGATASELARPVLLLTGTPEAHRADHPAGEERDGIAVVPI
ncbi:PIN domain-containing protein [Saccharopolyspora sp. MS10]|uniref:PIN domain-containing protein n=1 Tax=Saccharopolyspora sp. MS10 TaxID=3385973 RepID=UPI00399FCDC4